MSCEGKDRAYLIMLVSIAEGFEKVSDDELKKQLATEGKAAGIQRHEYPLMLVRVPPMSPNPNPDKNANPFTKETGLRNNNYKPMRKKIDEFFRAPIDEAYVKGGKMPSDKWID